MDFSTIQTLAHALGFKATRKLAFCEGEKQAAAKLCPSAVCVLKSLDGLTIIYCQSYVVAFNRLQEAGRAKAARITTADALQYDLGLEAGIRYADRKAAQPIPLASDYAEAARVLRARFEGRNADADAILQERAERAV